MQLSELLSFITATNQALQERYGTDADPEKRTLRQVVKMMEEMGELSEAVLHYLGLQRTDKTDLADDGHLGEEVADALITVLLVACTMDVDVETALVKKMEKIKGRFGMAA